MFVTNHTLAGTLIGTRLRRHPEAAFAAGILSHLLMDSLPHWGAEGDGARWMQIARRDGLVGLAALTAVAGVTPPGSRAGVLAGAVGAVLPDLRSPFQVAFDVQPLPDALDEVHTDVQKGKEARRRLPAELTTAVLLALTVVAAVSGLRREASRRGAGRTPGS